MSKEFKEVKWATCLTMGLTIASAWIWKFFPIQAYPEYLWIKEDAGVMAWILGGLTMVLFTMFAFGLMSTIFQGAIWKAEKRFIRRFDFRIHWSVGMLASFGITIATVISAVGLGATTFDMEALFDMTGGAWPIFGVLALLVTGTAFGWALFVVHAKIANHLNRSNPPFMV